MGCTTSHGAAVDNLYITHGRLAPESVVKDDRNSQLWSVLAMEERRIYDEFSAKRSQLKRALDLQLASIDEHSRNLDALELERCRSGLSSDRLPFSAFSAADRYREQKHLLKYQRSNLVICYKEEKRALEEEEAQMLQLLHEEDAGVQFAASRLPFQTVRNRQSSQLDLQSNEVNQMHDRARVNSAPGQAGVVNLGRARVPSSALTELKRSEIQVHASQTSVDLKLSDAELALQWRIHAEILAHQQTVQPFAPRYNTSTIGTAFANRSSSRVILSSVLRCYLTEEDSRVCDRASVKILYFPNKIEFKSRCTREDMTQCHNLRSVQPAGWPHAGTMDGKCS